jgi:hypothetical protein
MGHGGGRERAESGREMEKYSRGVHITTSIPFGPPECRGCMTSFSTIFPSVFEPSSTSTWALLLLGIHKSAVESWVFQILGLVTTQSSSIQSPHWVEEDTVAKCSGLARIAWATALLPDSPVGHYNSDESPNNQKEHVAGAQNRLRTFVKFHII